MAHTRGQYFFRCPFQDYEYTRKIPIIVGRHRVIVPDLQGLGDADARLDGDCHLPHQVNMVFGLMDRLGIERAVFVGREQAASVCQLMMRNHPKRLRVVAITIAGGLRRVAERAGAPGYGVGGQSRYHSIFPLLGTRMAQRWICPIALQNRAVLTDEVLTSFARPNTATPERWLRLRRLLSWQLDDDHNLRLCEPSMGCGGFGDPL